MAFQQITAVVGTLPLMSNFVEEVETAEVSGPEREDMVMETLAAVLALVGAQRTWHLVEPFARGLIRLLVGLKHKTGRFTRKQIPVQGIVGSLKDS